MALAAGVAWAQTPAAANTAQNNAKPAVGLPAVELFFKLPAYQQLALSPSGRWLAMSTAVGSKRVNLVVFDLQQNSPPLQVAGFLDSDIRQFKWVNDETLVFDVFDYLRPAARQRWWSGLVSVSREGKNMRRLIDPDWQGYTSKTTTGRQELTPNHSLLFVPKNGGSKVLVGEWKYTQGGEPLGVVAKSLDVLNGRTEELAEGAPANIYEWRFDPQGNPRLIFTRNGARAAYHWRDAGSKVWRQLAEFDALQPPWLPEKIDSNGQLFVGVSSGVQAVRQVHLFDFKTGKPQAEPLVSTPGFDFSGEIITEKAGGPTLGVRTQVDAEITVWFDPRMKALQQVADQRLPGRVNRITCKQCDSPDLVALVESWSDQQPEEAWLYRDRDKSWRLVASQRPDIDPRRMAITDFSRIKARDGLEIPVWVTKPAAKSATPRPAVVLVHGGPWVRGRVWEWESDAQFLASRGYVVIEPEFRSSTGYGNQLYQAGWKQWGTQMQDDLADALAWAVAQGVVDKNRVCVAGASYGGYATLMSLVRHPDLYRCGVAWVAVSDPRLMMKWSGVTDIDDFSRNVGYPALIGDPVADREMLDAATPLLHANKIKAPLMLAMGRVDARVPLEHGLKMRQALIDAGNPPEWLLYNDEAHGFYLAANRIDFMTRMELFLAKNLAPR